MTLYRVAMTGLLLVLIGGCLTISMLADPISPGVGRTGEWPGLVV